MKREADKIASLVFVNNAVAKGNDKIKEVINVPKEKWKSRNKPVGKLNPQINSQTDTPSMGSWPVSPAAVLDKDYEENLDANDDYERLP